jgi:hypothetical protein
MVTRNIQPSSPKSPNQRNRRAEFDTLADERYAKVIAFGLTTSWDDMRAHLENRDSSRITKWPAIR